MFSRHFLQALIIFWSGLAFAFEMKTNVKVTEPLRIDLYDSYQAVGEVKIATSRDFYTKIPGTITYITRKQGGSIKAGDVIVEINGSVAHAMHEKSLSAFKAADFSFKKDQALFNKKLTSEDAFRKAQLNHETAKHDHEKAVQEYSEMVIVAPFDGDLGVTTHHVGDNLANGDYLLSMTNGNEAEVIVYLPEKLINQVRPDTKVELLFSKNENVAGHVIATSPHISKTSGNFVAKIASDIKGLKHGSYVKIKFFLNQHSGLVVPEAAVQKNEDGSFVFIAEESSAKQVHVILGTRLDGNVEVLNGLTEGQKVIVEGLTSLKKGSPVAVME